MVAHAFLARVFMPTEMWAAEPAARRQFAVILELNLPLTLSATLLRVQLRSRMVS